jgi:hypothetical protein
VVVEDFIIPLPVSDETPSQKTRRGMVVDNKDAFPQRRWLSRGFDKGYIYDPIGGEGSIVYVIGTGLTAHTVSNFFRFVGLFKHQN